MYDAESGALIQEGSFDVTDSSSAEDEGEKERRWQRATDAISSDAISSTFSSDGNGDIKSGRAWCKAHGKLADHRLG